MLLIHFFSPHNILSVALIQQISIVTILIVTVTFFLILLILGIRKSYKLKAENERLSKKTPEDNDDKKDTYKDFTEGHLYD